MTQMDMCLIKKIDTNSKQCQLIQHNFLNDQAECCNRQCQKEINMLDQPKPDCINKSL